MSEVVTVSLPLWGWMLCGLVLSLIGASGPILSTWLFWRKRRRP